MEIGSLNMSVILLLELSELLNRLLELNGGNTIISSKFICRKDKKLFFIRHFNGLKFQQKDLMHLTTLKTAHVAISVFDIKNMANRINRLFAIT